MTDRQATAALAQPVVTRETGWSTIGIFIGISLAIVLAYFLVLPKFTLGAFVAEIDWLHNLFLFGVLLLLGVGGVLGLRGGLRPSDVGLSRSKVGEAVIVTAVVWLTGQALLATAALLSYGHLEWHGAWTAFGIADVLLWAAAMFLGTALFEEIAFRGYLFPQLYLKVTGSHPARLWKGLIVSQLLFGIFHIPGHIILRDMTGLPLAVRVIMHALGGMLGVAIYLRTRNLGVMVGLHGLENAPTPLVAGPIPSELLYLPFVFIILIAWPWLTRRPEQRGFARVQGEKEASTYDTPFPIVQAQPPPTA